MLISSILKWVGREKGLEEVQQDCWMSIDEMALEYRKLSENLKRLEESGNGEIGEPIRDRITELTKGIAMAMAQNTGQLALKASVALRLVGQ